MRLAEQIRQIMAPVEGRVRLMIGRGVVNRSDDAARVQALQIDLLSEETHDGVERMQDYGFTSVPHAGAEAVVACVGGLRSHGIAIAVADRRYRLRGLQAGEVALYDDLGNVVKLGRTAITITAVDQARIAAPMVVIESDDLQIGGAGGQPVARVGDSVDLATGKIISGSSKVTAA